MKQAGVSAYIIPTADPHLSEYIADHWKLRERLSGFNGSAGTLLVATDKAYLWTDSRYFLQATEQLDGTGIELMKDGQAGTPNLALHICRTQKGGVVGIDGKLFAAAWVENVSKIFDAVGIKLTTNLELDGEWKDRPQMPNSDIYAHPVCYSGEDVAQKLMRVRKEMTNHKCTHCLISALDEVAYMLNLRGGDVTFNPVFYAYLLIGSNYANLYIDSNEANGRHIAGTPTEKVLNTDGINVKPYADITKDLERLGREAKVLIDKRNTNHLVANALKDSNIKDAASPASMMKAVKNDIQVENLKKAQLQDSVSMTKAFCWLENEIEKNGAVTEQSFADKLDKCRAEREGYKSLSFNTISAFAHHGAIVHYSVSQETDIQLHKGEFFLVDSGGNYMTGTTDITRTVHLGGNTPSNRKKDYTLVLKGHIALARAVFPTGTTGTQLDALARMPLWQSAKNFGHGTGHGIGHFLCVHEGPQRISTAINTVPLAKGMFISNEPGLYIEGNYGIRLENMVCVQPFATNEFGTFLKLETMSYFPFDIESIETDMLDETEKKWLNDYHQKTFKDITATGLLTKEEMDWLKNKTKKI